MPSDSKIREILSGPGMSFWLKNALLAALDRDPVDAANDADLLAIVLGYRAQQLGKEGAAALEALDAIVRAKQSASQKNSPDP